jgi:hypothetical protein
MQKTNQRIEGLQGLLERLSDPGLTLAEAKELRVQLFELMERGDAAPGSSSEHGRGRCLCQAL